MDLGPLAVWAATLPWRVGEPIDGAVIGWHVRIDADEFDFVVCETFDEGLARLIVEEHNSED